VLYLHGFRSSPHSTKARQFCNWLHAHRPDIHWWCPQLPPSPCEAIALLVQGTATWPLTQAAVIGSSLGGFYATVLAERWDEPVRTVLLNPAVQPARDLADWIGETSAWHSDERFFFRPEFIAELRDLAPSAITRSQRYFAVIAKGDEVLDWREMASRYMGCPMRLLEGNDHALSDFEAPFTAVRDFLGLEEKRD
jgi:predicted esterase YcpF (UPF0227 family)